MIELGKKQVLKVLRKRENGVYLGEREEDETGVLLPKRQVPEGVASRCRIDAGSGVIGIRYGENPAEGMAPPQS